MSKKYYIVPKARAKGDEEKETLTMDFEIIKNAIAGVIRTLLTPVVTYLVANGYLGDSQAVQLTAILASLAVAVLWSVVSKLLAAKQVEVALELPGGTSKETLKDVLASK